VKATSDQLSIINKYLQTIAFGDIESLDTKDRERELITSLRGITNKDSYFLLSGKLFSQVVTDKMALYNKSRQIEFIWQQDFMDIFKKVYEETRATGSEPWESEVQTAKILWNAIKEEKFSTTAEGILDIRDSRLTEEIDLELIDRFNVQRNLINIVRSSVTLLQSPSSVYQESSSLVEKAIKLYESKRYKETNVLFELALKNIQALEGNSTAVSFAVLTGCLQILNSVTISKGLYLFQRAEKIIELIDDKSAIGDSLDEMARGYWRIGLYKKTLDMLSMKLYIHTLQKNELYIMFTEEKLSNFFYNLHRFIEAQEWALHFLNSAVRSTDDDLKITYFLQANLNYAKILKGLNSWAKAIEHLNYSERTLNHLDLSSEIRNPLQLDISHTRGDIAVARGDFKMARQIFESGKEKLVSLKTTSPVFIRFLRSQAIFYRNQLDFKEGINVLQPLFQEKNKTNPQNVSLLAELLTLHSHEDAALRLLEQAEEQLNQWNSITGLSFIYLSKGHTYLLMEDFGEASKWFHNSLDIISTDLVNLKSYIDAHLSLGYLELEKGNLKLAERHQAFADEKASTSGSLGLLLDSQFLKANLRIKQGFQVNGLNMIRQIAQEAKDLEISFMLSKARSRLEQ
jgi:tetratricopeptide (TPR) repeat protein